MLLGKVDLDGFRLEVPSEEQVFMERCHGLIEGKRTSVLLNFPVFIVKA